MIKNVYAYLDEYMDRDAVESKEHIGYIVDRMSSRIPGTS